MATSKIRSIWGDVDSEETERRPTFAQRLKQGNAKMSASDLAARAAQFETIDSINHKEMIQFFQQKFRDENCIRQLMPLAAFPGRCKWIIIFLRPSMVDSVIEELIKLPSLPEGDPGIAYIPARRRALLITIPDASPHYFG